MFSVSVDCKGCGEKIALDMQAMVLDTEPLCDTCADKRVFGDAVEADQEPLFTVHGPQPGVRSEWLWLCERCGWRGVGLFSEGSATREAQRHVESLDCKP